MPYVAPAQLRQVGAGIWRAAAAFTTPLLPDDYLTLINPLWSTRRMRGQVERVIPETEDAATLVIRPGWHWPAHRAGQWVMASARIEGVWNSRAYSITSPAGAAGRFRITVKAVADGHVSQHLVHRTTPGDVLRLALPRGEFVLPDRVPARILFLTGGSGITPAMGMLRTLAGGSSRPDLVHVHSARRPSDVIFGAELRALSRRMPGYRLYEQHTETNGRFTLGRLDELCPDWRQRPTWACGPAGQLADIEAQWEQAGAHDRLHVERFRPAFFAAPDADGGSVTFTRTGREAAAPAGTPLLVVGEHAGVAMPSGCRMGICFSCVAPLRSGQVRDLRTGQVHGEEGELVQTCVSGAAGTCAVDL
jgi:stearoyl-CoA 9-desaturase NADPH oxidoreductase